MLSGVQRFVTSARALCVLLGCIVHTAQLLQAQRVQWAQKAHDAQSEDWRGWCSDSVLRVSAYASATAVLT